MNNAIQRIEVMNTVTKEMLFEDYIRNIHIKYFLNSNTESTMQSYMVDYNNDILPYFRDKRLCDITSIDVQNFLIYLQNERKINNNTVIKEFCLINKPLRILTEHHILDKNVCTAVEIPKVKFNRTQPVPLKDLVKILKIIKKNIIEEIPILLCLILGLRKGEAYGLKWNDIDWKKRLVTIHESRIYIGAKYVVKETKTDGSVRILKIPKLLLRKLKKWKRKQSKFRKQAKDEAIYNDYICTDTNGELLKAGYLEYRFERIEKILNLNYKLTLRALRSTIATILAHENVSVYNISKYLGHTNTQTTVLHYIVHIDSSFDFIANKINKIFK